MNLEKTGEMSMEKKNILGEMIKEAREKKGLSQRQLAKNMNIDNGEISRIEKGKRKQPSFYTLKKLYNELNIDIVELMKAAEYKEEAIKILTQYKDEEIREYPKEQWTEEDMHIHSLQQALTVDLNKVIKQFIKGELDEKQLKHYISRKTLIPADILFANEINKIYKKQIKELEKIKENKKEQN